MKARTTSTGIGEDALHVLGIRIVTVLAGKASTYARPEFQVVRVQSADIAMHAIRGAAASFPPMTKKVVVGQCICAPQGRFVLIPFRISHLYFFRVLLLAMAK